MSARRLEVVVSKLLKDAEIGSPPVPVDQIARALGARIRHFPFQGEGDISGMLFRGDKEVVIGVNSLHHPNRQRFTIAHEIGHLVLHKGIELHVDKAIFAVHLRDDVSSQAIVPDEVEANRFAAELLMPRHMLLAEVKEQGMDIESEEELLNLAKRYRVSVQALTFRLANLGLISLPDNPGGRR